MAILAVLTSFALPLFRDLVIESQLSTNVNELVAATRLARSEAVRRGRLVTLCRAVNVGAGTGECSTKSSGGRTGSDWGAGWLVYVENSSSAGIGASNQGEEILLRHLALPGKTHSPGAKGSITYNGTGLPVGSMTGARIRFNFDGRFSRVVCIDRSGRVRVIRDELDCN